MRYLPLILLFLLSALQPAAARDFSGSYSGNCDGAVQCAIDITDNKQLSVIVADRLDYAKKKCVVSGTWQESQLGLAGTMDNGIRISIVGTPDSGIYVNGIPTKACGRNLNGYYPVIGD